MHTDLSAKACAASSSTRCTAATPTPCTPLPPLIPPFRHCVVEEGLYRGAHPSLKNMRYMRRLNLQTMLSLLPDKAGPPQDLTEYCKAERIHHICHHVEKYDDEFSHTPQLVASILSDLIDPRNQPLFLHCRDGAHNTGIVVMCLRRLQNWSLPNIFREFTRYTKSNFISYEEKQFVESFHATVTVPMHIPRWLWDGVRHRRHPSIQLCLERDPGTPASLHSPSASVARELDLSAPLMGLLPKHRDITHLTSGKPWCKRIELRYTTRLAALDLYGVHLLKQ